MPGPAIDHPPCERQNSAADRQDLEILLRKAALLFAELPEKRVGERLSATTPAESSARIR